MIKPKHEKLYMDIAERCAKESYAKRLKVGCVIIKDNNIISMSWNGTPPGWSNNCETENNKTKPEVYHAEESTILKLAKHDGGCEGTEMFVTHAPCVNCAKMIFRSGVNMVYYKHDYRDSDGLDFLRNCKIHIQKLGD
jgi:dCMP deaminase